MTTATNTSLSNEHYTPASIVEAARATLGSIDLDPASCAKAQEVVQAKVWYSEQGLQRPWAGRVFLNPPGGKLDPETFEAFKPGPGRSMAKAVSAAAVWWCQLVTDWHAGLVESAIFVAFNMGVFRTCQNLGPGISPPQAFPFCVLRERLAFDHIDASGARVPGKSPPQDSAIILLPIRRGAAQQRGCTPEEDGQESEACLAQSQRFYREYSRFGYVRR